jgi:hypothetical protein
MTIIYWGAQKTSGIWYFLISSRSHDQRQYVSFDALRKRRSASFPLMLGLLLPPQLAGVA